MWIIMDMDMIMRKDYIYNWMAIGSYIVKIVIVIVLIIISMGLDMDMVWIVKWVKQVAIVNAWMPYTLIK